MSQAANQERIEQPPPGETRQTHLPILSLVETLEQVCLSDQPPDKLISELLRGFVGLSDAEYAAYLRVDAHSKQLAVAAELMPRVTEAGARAWGPQIAELAAGVIQQAIIRYRAVSEPGDRVLTGQGYTAVAFPVRGDAAVAGAVVVVVKDGSVILTDTGISMLRLLANFGLLSTTHRAAHAAQQTYHSLSNAWSVVSEIMAFTKPVEMAEVLVNRARSAFGADRASVGFVKGEKVTVAAVSGQDIIDKRSNIVKHIRAAQMEVVVSGEAHSYQIPAEGEDDAEQRSRSPQHVVLAEEGEAKTVYSLPLRHDQDIVGVATFEYQKEPLAEGVRQVLDIVAGQMGPLLYLALQNARAIRQHMRDGAKAAAQKVFGKEHPWRRAIGTAIVALLVFAIFGRCDFNISGSCQLEPSLRRIYSAPFSAVIEAAPVRPGDLVKKGDVILRFEQEDLRMQLREISAKLVSTEKQMASELAEGKVADYAESVALRQAYLAEKQLIERHLAQTVVKSGQNGIVLEGDLKQDIGRPVQMGTQLIIVAPLEQLLLEMYVAQDDVAYIKPEQEGEFTTKAVPGKSIPFTVTKVRPSPVVYQGESMFVAEALVSNPSGALRTGMEGAARVTVGRRNVTWIATRKILNWLRLKLWW